MNEMINIGNISTTHHLDGAVKIKTGFMHLDLLVNEKVLIETKTNNYILTIKSVKKMNEKKYIVKFLEIKNINEASDLIGSSIKIRSSLIPKVDSNEYYTNDLISFRVYNEKEYIGDVTDILETNAHDILVVLNNDKEILIPFVEDVFIKEIDFDENKIITKLLEGML